MDLALAKRLAIKLMTEHGLIEKGWSFDFDNSKRGFGYCNYRLTTIGLSKPLTMLNDEVQVRDTILHEIAHALVGGYNNHNHIWKAKAIEIGCNGKLFYGDEVKKPKSKYILLCNTCGLQCPMYRKPSRQYSCNKCHPRSYNEKFKMDIIQQY